MLHSPRDSDDVALMVLVAVLVDVLVLLTVLKGVQPIERVGDAERDRVGLAAPPESTQEPNVTLYPNAHTLQFCPSKARQLGGVAAGG